MTLNAFTDGASRGNPGEAGIGIIVKDEAKNTLLSLHGSIGVTTNNIAEYTALVTLLERISVFPCAQLVIHSDSELLVRQINGEYRVRDRGLKALYHKAIALKEALPFACSVRHIPREENREADRLANRGIEEKRPVGRNV